MIELRLSLDALGRTRFAYSPLAEVAGSLRLLGDPSAGYVVQPWLREVRPRLRGIDMDLLQAVAPPGHLSPDFLFPWTSDPTCTVDQQLSSLADLPAQLFEEQLGQVWSGRLMPEALRSLLADPAMPRRLADVVWEYWQVAIAPHWTRMRSVIDDDVAYRASRVLSGGLYDLLGDLHAEVSLDGARLLIDKPQHQAVYSRAELTLVPSVFVWPHLIVGHDAVGHFELFYAARGVGRVWEGVTEAAVDDALAALIGRSRASILTRLAAPMSTTQLARDLGQSPASVSQHLSVLRRSGLLTSWRSGRSVLYRRTPLASSIVSLNESRRGREQPA